MKKTLITLLFACLTTGYNSELDTNIINVSDYGIIPNTKECITSKINKIIENLEDKPTTIIFPKGRYDFYPDSNYLKNYYETNTYDINPKRLAIFLERKRNITIDAKGSDFIYHDHIQPFTVDNCSNIKIKNVNIDWDNPLTAESEIIEADSTHILIKIDKGQFPYTVHSKGLTFASDSWKEEWQISGASWLIEFDKNHIIPPHTGDHGSVNGDFSNIKYSEVEPGLVLIEGNFTKTPDVGNHWVMRYGARDHAGIFLFHSKNIELENIDVYHTSGLGILSQYCENIDMKRVNMIPNPKKNRYLSSHDDGLHFMGCKGDIFIDECNAQGLMDDPINIHGTYAPVTEKIDDYTLKCTYAHAMSTALIWAKKGDTIGFVEKKNMLTRGRGGVDSFSELDTDNFTIRFKDKLPNIEPNKYSLENMSLTPNVTIKNCFVGSSRARGYLITTAGKVLIENNIFETSGSAILIAGDANFWYESGPIRDLIIRNNEFRTPCNSSAYQFCNGVISIYPEIPNPDPQIPYHRNIRIENNSFNPSDYPILYAKSVEGLSFKNNTITRSYDYKPWHPHKYSFLLESCKDVEISGNSIDKDLLGKNIMLKSMGLEELKLSNDELSIEVDKK
ncbi:MAG: alpha-1,3-galactosidase B [Candidatus Cloacimonadota bacterium]|nr:MAG: alpha-1,3-galactosidase B [Candidatus Cloacimonadota bacterium]PIE77352.1 MAG: alpha-1,3-galactosidase B [Candidatus Delongbacteria bacterium]